jgi:hypothetical protein
MTISKRLLLQMGAALLGLVLVAAAQRLEEISGNMRSIVAAYRL